MMIGTKGRKRAVTWLLAVALICTGAAFVQLRPARASEKQYVFGDPAKATVAEQVTLEKPTDFASNDIAYWKDSVPSGGTNEGSKTFYLEALSGIFGMGAVRLHFSSPIEDMSSVDSLTFAYSLTNSAGLPTGESKSTLRIYGMNVSDGVWTVNPENYISVTEANATGFTLTGEDLMKLADNEGRLEYLQIECHAENGANTLLAVSEISYVEKAAEAYDIVTNATRGTITIEGGGASAVAGETVRFTATPDTNKELKSLQITYGEGTTVEYDDEGSNVYSFTMPAGDVTITAVFDSDIYKEFYTGDRNEVSFAKPTNYADPQTAAWGNQGVLDLSWSYELSDTSFALKAYAGYQYGAVNLTFRDGAEDASRIKKLSIEVQVSSFDWSESNYYRLYPVNEDGTIGSAGYVEISSSDVPVRNEKITLEFGPSEIAKLANDDGGIKTLQWATKHSSSDMAYFTVTSVTYECYAAGEFPVRVGAQDNCEVTLTSGTSAENGDTVTFAVTPAEKYRVDEVTVTKASGGDVMVTPGENGSYSFTMPAEAVTISVSCVSDVLKDLLLSSADVTFSTPEYFANAQTEETFRNPALVPTWFYSTTNNTAHLIAYSGLGYGAANLTFTNPIADTSKVKSLTISLTVSEFNIEENYYYRLYPVNADGTVVTSRYFAFDESNITARGERIEIVLEGSEIDALTDDDGTLTRLQWASYHLDSVNNQAIFEIHSISYELYAESDYHTVTFKDFEGGTAQTVTTARGVDPLGFTDLPGYEEKTGYSPVWKTESGEEIFDFSQNVTADVVLVPGWQINTYTLEFEADGAPLNPITQEYGTALTLPDAPEKTGYTFVGWFRNAEGTGDAFTAATMPAENIKLYAVYESISFTITTSVEHATVTVDGTAGYGETVSFTVTPEAGYRVTDVKATYGTSGSEFEVTEQNGTYTFTILADTTIAVETERASYSVAASGEHVTFGGLAETAGYGDTVSFTAEAQDGYTVTSVSVTDAEGNAVTVTQGEDGSWSFTMPAGNVTITAETEQLKGCGCGTVGLGAGGIGFLVLAAGSLLIRKQKKQSV